jgi:hypothetical protein
MWSSVLLVWRGVLVSLVLAAVVGSGVLGVVFPYLIVRHLLPWEMPSSAWVTALVQGMSWAEICATWPAVQALLLRDLAMAWGLAGFAVGFGFGAALLIAPLLACCPRARTPRGHA